jgi:hypothetical protein
LRHFGSGNGLLEGSFALQHLRLSEEEEEGEEGEEEEEEEEEEERRKLRLKAWCNPLRLPMSTWSGSTRINVTRTVSQLRSLCQPPMSSSSITMRTL